MGSGCAMAVMAKAPRPGHVKTRLQGLLAPEEAARMGAAFLHDTVLNLQEAARLAPITPVIAYAPAGQEALLPGGVALLLADGTGGAAEGVEGFGRVLLETMRALFAQGHEAACVVAADSPTLPTGSLVAAASHLLCGSEAVLGASEDGGYYLLGLRRADARPFARIRWSTEHAAADTRARCAEAGLAVVELPPWFDVDDPPALRRLLAGDGGYAAPHTRAVLAALSVGARLQAHA